MSKTTLVLFLIAVICYLLAWTDVAIGLGAVGIVFELFTYISMFADQDKVELQESEGRAGDYDDDINKDT